MNKTLISDISAQILLVTILAMAGIHFYELGYCRYFAIPVEYISIEINKYSIHLFLFLALFFILAMILDSLVGHFVLFVKVKNRYLRLTIILIFFALLIWLFSDVLFFLTLQEIIPLGTVFIFGVVLFLNKDKSDNNYDILSPKHSINIFLSRKFGAICGPILMLSSLICAFLFCLGYYNGQTQSSFASRPDGKTILLRKYGDNIVYGILSNGKVSTVFIEQNISKVDTLHFIKIK